MTTGQDTGGKQDPAVEAREALDLATKRRRMFFLFCCFLTAAVLGANILYGTVLRTPRVDPIASSATGFQDPN